MLNQALRVNLEQHENGLSVFLHQLLSLLLQKIRHSLDVLVAVNLALLIWLLLEYKDYIHTFHFNSNHN